jgi:radical SAM superfamily enzyme YgiQ (UPF0313 family)
VRTLLISTYELGRQPVHVASPAAALLRAGHEVTTVDLAVETLTVDDLAGLDAVAISVPMHTAMRLAIAAAREVRAQAPGMPIALYGLYATVGSQGILGRVADRLIGGEYEAGLVDWVDTLGVEVGSRASVDVGRSPFQVPQRATLPSLDQYARLEWQGEARLVGAVEASHGCRHRCRHCPIPVLYDGRLRVVGVDTVLADIDQLVSAKAQHITFGDPDFLNAPRYSLDILRAAHSAHPKISYDITVKVSHILQHRSLWAEMAELGVLFVVSAFESVDDHTLEILDKGHTVVDMVEAATIVRSAGIHLRPTWLPFFPWTTGGDLVGLARFLDLHRLWEATDPVQLAIKLLIPEGSLLETHPAVTPHLIGYEPGSLTWEWQFADPEVEHLHKRLDSIAADASDCGAEAMTTLGVMRQAICDAAGVEPGPIPLGAQVPRLTESWFCCAEPTADQAASVGLRIGMVDPKYN